MSTYKSQQSPIHEPPRQNSVTFHPQQPNNQDSSYQSPQKRTGPQKHVPIPAKRRMSMESRRSVESRREQLEEQEQKELQEQIDLTTIPVSVSFWNMMVAIVMFIVGYSVFVAVWAIEKFAVLHQISSHYYEAGYNWFYYSTAKTSVDNSIQGVALMLVTEWMVYKAPLILFTYNCIRLNNSVIKWVSLAVATVILLVADIILSVFVLNIYNNMMYFGLFAVVTALMAVLNNPPYRTNKQALLDSLLPLIWVAFAVSIQVLFFPALFRLFISINGLTSNQQIMLILYLYPLIDLIMFGTLLYIGTFLSKQVRLFHSILHFLLIGYEVGFTLLAGYTQVEFFYLIMFFVFRNICCNYVLWKWDKTINTPPALPMWPIAYYFSYIFNFLPIGGIGNIVLSTGYYSKSLIQTNTLLYEYSSNLYFNNPYTPSGTETFALNTSMQGNICFIAALIIWVGLTFSQKYNTKVPQLFFSIVYYVFGTYLFYWGLTAGVSLQSLALYSIFF